MRTLPEPCVPSGYGDVRFHKPAVCPSFPFPNQDIHDIQSIMDTISWTDAIRASVSSCVPCLGPSADNRPPESLDGLLSDNVSLHSNIGNPNARRKRNRKKKNSAVVDSDGNRQGITLFGFNLFGKRQGAIQLPEDPNEPLHGAVHSIRTRTSSQTSTGHYSDSDLQADAAPLTSAYIAQFTPEQLQQRALEAEEAARLERIAKEERRAKRRERKELKRLAASGALAGGSEEFEGFQGSGAGSDFLRSRIPSPLLDGEFLEVQPGGPSDHVLEEDDGADLDGLLYTRAPRGDGSSAGGSDSRRSPSDLSSNGRGRRVAQPEFTPEMTVPKKTKRKKSSKQSHSSATSSTLSPSTPVSPSFEGVNTPLQMQIPPHVLGAKTDSGFPSPRLGLTGGRPRGGSNALQNIFVTRHDDDGL